MTDGTDIELHNPADMPDVVKISEIREPWIRATIMTPDDYLGGILKLCQERRGIQVDLSYVGSARHGRPTICRSTRSCSTSTTG
jgi:GTP-binding protein LepA